MLVKEVMSSPAITVTATTSVKEGLKVLDEHRISSLPVLDGGGRIVGIVSEADLLRNAVHQDPRAHLLPIHEADEHPTRVAEVMTALPMTVRAESDVHEAVELMTSTAVKSLPVVESGRVIGVVSRSDVVHSLARSDERIRVEVDELLRSAGVEADLDVVDGVVNIRAIADQALQRVAEVIARSVAGVISVQEGRIV